MRRKEKKDLQRHVFPFDKEKKPGKSYHNKSDKCERESERYGRRDNDGKNMKINDGMTITTRITLRGKLKRYVHVERTKWKTCFFNG